MVVDAAGEIYGDVANIAARVQALAEPGTVLVTARVQHQIAGLFVVEERGSHALKGVPGAGGTCSGSCGPAVADAASGQRHLTPLVGRDEEIALLMRRWERARQGEGQLVLIVGEPGLGKSRLIEEFHARLRDTPHTWVEWNCSQLLQNTPLHPIAEWGRQRFGGADVPGRAAACRAGKFAWRRSSSTRRKMRPCSHRFSTFRCRRTRARFSARGIAAPAIGGADQLGDGRRTGPAGGACARRLHWADPTTLDVLRGIAERGALAPLFVRGDRAARVSAVLGHALASRHDLSCPARSCAGAAHGRRTCRPPCAAEAKWWTMSLRALAACRCSSRK